MTYQLTVLPEDAWARRVADLLVDRLRANARMRVCLPTGETPAPLYDELASRTDVSWAGVEVVLLDEYLGLPPGDPALGGDRLRRELIDRLADPPAAFHPIRMADDPHEAADRHDAVAAEGLDLTLVGIGLNGHVGFNEPGSGPDSPTAVVDLSGASQSVATDAYGAGDAPERGITLGLRRVLESREVWLLATGERKADILARALEGPESDDVPASFLRRHPRLQVFADDRAAGKLRRHVAGS